MEHTKEPWEYIPASSMLPFVVTDSNGKREAFAVDTDNGDNDARRIVACVNACAGVTTDTLESMRPVRELIGMYERLSALHDESRKQRDELLSACQTFAEWLRREDEGFVKAGNSRDTPEGEAKWREWYDENLRLCSLAQTQAIAAITNAKGA